MTVYTEEAGTEELETWLSPPAPSEVNARAAATVRVSLTVRYEAAGRTTFPLVDKDYTGLQRTQPLWQKKKKITSSCFPAVKVVTRTSYRNPLEILRLLHRKES